MIRRVIKTARRRFFTSLVPVPVPQTNPQIFYDRRLGGVDLLQSPPPAARGLVFVLLLAVARVRYRVLFRLRWSPLLRVLRTVFPFTRFVVADVLENLNRGKHPSPRRLRNTSLNRQLTSLLRSRCMGLGACSALILSLLSLAMALAWVSLSFCLTMASTASHSDMVFSYLSRAPNQQRTASLGTTCDTYACLVSSSSWCLSLEVLPNL